MTSIVDFGWKPTTTAIFVGIRHVGVNAPHHFSQKPPLKFFLLVWVVKPAMGQYLSDRFWPIILKFNLYVSFYEWNMAKKSGYLAGYL